MLGEPLLRLDETDSTNRVALDWDDAPHGACVVARVQTSGRGRLGRHWESAPDKGLYLSLVLQVPQAEVALYSLSSALGVVAALESLTGLDFRVKWPNDVLAISGAGEAHKIGGILCEAKGEKMVVGVGVNVNQSADELPARPIFSASSLSIQSGREWEIDSVLHSVLSELSAVFAVLENDGWNGLRAEFERKCQGIGEVIQVKTGDETLIGVFESIDVNGALMLRTAEGIKQVMAGDVIYF